MNREILFRGKRIDNGEWITGGYFFEPYSEKVYITVWNTFGLGFIESIEVDPSTVGQYILTNKNGKKVFEGDIVKRYDSARAYQVKWNPTFPAFWCFRSSDYKFLLTEGFEVIGNIHDNPELLEEAK